MSKVVRNVHQIKTPKQKVSVILLTAGVSSGGKYLGNKSLLLMNNRRTLLENQIQTIHKVLPSAEIVLVSGFEAGRVMDMCEDHVICVENERYEETNTTKSLGMGLRAATGNKVIVIYGDVVFNSTAISKVDLDKSSLLYHDSNEHESVGCVINEFGHLENLMYGVGKHWIQIFSLVGKELDLLRSITWDKKNEKLLGFEAINKAISSGGSFSCITNKNIVALDIDNVQDFKKAKKIIL